MTERIPLDDLTSYQLDQLYAERDAVQERLDFHDRTTLPNLHRRIEADAETIRRWRGRAESAELRAGQAEAAIERVRAVHTRGTRTNACNDCGQPWPCELTRALNQAQQPSTTDTCVRHADFTAAIGYPVRCPHCPPDAAPIPATHWTKHVQRHHSEQQPTT